MYKNKSILELREMLDNGKVSSDELFENSLLLAKKYQDNYNSFVTILDNFKLKKSNSIISGIPYSLKDNFSTKGILTTASSNILKDYVPVYDSTVYKKLKRAGALLVGKTVLDELAMGGTGTTSFNGVVKNPWNKEHMIGGSSAGSASSVALGIVPYSIGSDTGDSVRKPASYAGVVGFKPSYGRISRYGLFAFASSLDHVGIFARNVKDVAIVTDVLKGKDEKDMTTLENENINYVDYLNNDITGKKLFYIKEIAGIENYVNASSSVKETIDSFHKLINKIKEKGVQVEEVSVDKNLLEAIYPTYMCISCAEATSNNSNLTGIQFGPRPQASSIEEIMFKARTEGFSELIKRRFILGSFILQKENQEKLFLNACRVRRLIVDEINKLFDKYDGLILPAAGSGAPNLSSISEKISNDYVLLENHLAIGNFGGMPSITIPFTMVNSLPVGVNITCRKKEDALTLNIANKIEELTGMKDLYCEVGDDDV